MIAPNTHTAQRQKIRQGFVNGYRNNIFALKTEWIREDMDRNAICIDIVEYLMIL